MELGSWSLLDGPSLIGLLPLFIYVVLAIKMPTNMVLPLSIAVFIGMVLSGNGAVPFGKAVVSALGGLMGQVGVLVVMGAGLGGVMNKVGVTTTLCKWIIKAFRINSKKKAIYVLTICVVILAMAIGSAVTAAAVNVAFLIPIAAVFGIRPVTLAVIECFGGFAGMMISPFSATNIAGLQVTGLAFPEYFLWAAGPYVVVTFVCTLFTALLCEKQLDKAGNTERYELTEEERNYDIEVTPQRRNATIAFIVSFIGCIVYMVVSKGGMAFAFFYMAFLTFIITVFSDIKISEALDVFFEHGAKMLSMFTVLILVQVLLDTMSAMGGFKALGDICSNVVTNSEGSQRVIMLVATLFGVFGMNSAAGAEMLVLTEVFKPMVTVAGISMGMWSMVLISGGLISNFLYPGVTHFGIMGVTRTNDFKNLLKYCWVTGMIQFAFMLLYIVIVPIFA